MYPNTQNDDEMALIEIHGLISVVKSVENIFLLFPDSSRSINCSDLLLSQMNATWYLGNLSNCLAGVNASLVFLPKCFHSFSLKQPSNEINVLNEMLKKLTDTKNEFDIQIGQISNRIMKENQILLKKFRVLSDSSMKINQIYQNENKRVINSFKARTKLQDLWPQYSKLCSEFNSQQSLLFCLAFGYKDVLDNYKESHVSMIQQYDKGIILDVLGGLRNNIGLLVSYLHDAHEIANSGLSLLDNESHITFFIQSKCSFCDFPAPQFKKYTFKNRLLSPSSTTIPRNIFHHYPYSLFSCTTDYQPRDQNEIALKVGSLYFALEDNIQKWVLIVSIFGGKIGFAPLSNLCLISNKIVVDRETKQYLVVDKVCGNELNCQNLEGNFVSIHKSNAIEL